MAVRPRAWLRAGWERAAARLGRGGGRGGGAARTPRERPARRPGDVVLRRRRVKTEVFALQRPRRMIRLRPTPWYLVGAFGAAILVGTGLLSLPWASESRRVDERARRAVHGDVGGLRDGAGAGRHGRALERLRRGRDRGADPGGRPGRDDLRRLAAGAAGTPLRAARQQPVRHGADRARASGTSAGCCGGCWSTCWRPRS